MKLDVEGDIKDANSALKLEVEGDIKVAKTKVEREITNAAKEITCEQN